jgi:hypothetical protein
MGIFENVQKFVVSLLTVLVYSYVVVVIPKLSLLPVLISITFAIWLASTYGSILAPIIALGQCLLYYYNMDTFGHIMFLLLNLLLLLKLDTNKNNTKVKFRPYEKEIRNVLFKYNQTDKLSDVDSMLEAYAGQEKELLQHLEETFGKNGGKAPFSPSPQKKSGSISPSPIFSTREKIYRLVRRNQPDLVPHIEDLLRSHKGDEESLLTYLKKEFNAQENPSYRSNSTPVKQNHQDIVENARWEAQQAIKARIVAASERGQAKR